MKWTLTSGIIFLLFNLQTAFGASVDEVNQWILMSLNSTYQDISETNPGPYRCQSASADVNADTPKLAEGKRMVVCLKKYCDQLNSRINNRIDEMREMDREELVDLLRAHTESQEEFEQALNTIESGGYGTPVTCANNYPTRLGAHTMCAFEMRRCWRD